MKKGAFHIRITLWPRSIFQFLQQLQWIWSACWCMLLFPTIGTLLLTVKPSGAACGWPISIQQPVIYADVCSDHKHLESGKEYAPFRTLNCSVRVASNGHVIQLQRGVYREFNLRIDKQLTLKASGGPVRIGGEYDSGWKDMTIPLDSNKVTNARVYFPRNPGWDTQDQIACGGPFPIVVYAHALRDTSQTVPCDWLDENTLTETVEEDYKQAEGILTRLAKAGMIAIAVNWHGQWGFKEESDGTMVSGIADVVQKVITHMKMEEDRTATLPPHLKWWLAGKINFYRLGLIGHSMGGAGVLERAVQSRGSIKAVGVIAPACPNWGMWERSDASPGNYDFPCFKDRTALQNIPLLVIHGTHESQCQVGAFPKFIYCEANSPKHLIIISGANHFGYTDSICCEPNPDEPFGCGQSYIPGENAFEDTDGWDNPGRVGGREGKESQKLQQYTAANYLRAFFVHYLNVPTGTKPIHYLAQKDGSCECADILSIEGGNPEASFADLNALNVNVNVCSDP